MDKDIITAHSKDEKVKRTLRASLLDGIFANGMVGFTQDYFVPFLLLLGGTARQVGILNALQNLFASLMQLKSADLTVRVKSRRKIINSFVFLQALSLLPMVFMAVRCHSTPASFTVLVVMFASFGALSLSPWSSLMSDLVTTHSRGEYFGWRNKILGLVAVACGFSAGFILYKMSDVNRCYGFAIIFLCAFIFRLASWYFLTKMHEPPLTHKKEDQFTLIMFVRRLRESNFAKFVLFVALLNFSVNLAAPFFAVLMLRDLHFSYVLYAFITVSATLTVCLMMSRWGRLADKVGNLKVLTFTAPFIAVVPLLWILNLNPVFLFFAQVISGFAWAGFNLSVANFIYDAVTPEKRTRCIAYFSLFNGLALCLGSLTGGFLLRYLPYLFGYNILALFLISSVFRLFVAFLMPMNIKEVRPVKKISNKDLFLHMLGIRSVIMGDGA